MPRAFPVAFALLMILVGAHSLPAQNAHVPLPQNTPQSQNLTVGSRPLTAPGASADDIQQQQAIAANLQRQVEIKRDTEKMLQLTAELKDYLDKSGQSVMSVDAIKKAEQIEKLARSIKSKMKQSF